MCRRTRIGLEPAWWDNLETNVEGYTLRHGDTYLVNVINHTEETEDLTVSVDLEKMDFDQKRPVFIWQHQARPVLLAGQQYAEDIIDTLYVHRRLTKKKYVSRIKIALQDMPPHRIRVCTLTQTPAFVYSVDGIATQNLTSETLDCHITGTLNEASRNSTLSVNASRPIQMLAYWPTSWGRANTSVNGKGMAAEPIQIGGVGFQLIDLPKGESRLILTPTT